MHVEVFVVALDPVERRERREVLAVVAGDVADRHPERHVGVPRHDVLDGVERAVDVAERADLHVSGRRLGGWGWPASSLCLRRRRGAAVAGTSRSVLSQTKSSLL